MGKKGGASGGHARAANMTKEQRSEASRKAVQARWAKKKESGVGAGYSPEALIS